MAFIAAETTMGGGDELTVSVPDSASEGDRLFLFYSGQPGAPVSSPAGWTLLESNAAPTQSVGHTWIWTAVAASGGSTDPGGIVTVTLTGNSRGQLSCGAWGAAEVLDSVWDESIDGSMSTATTPSGSTPGPCIAIHAYGTISNGSKNDGAPVTWTADSNTTERIDNGSFTPAGGNGRQATFLVADEAIAAAGAVPGRTATPNVSVQSDRALILIGTEVAQPVADAGANQTVALGAAGVQLDGTASGGAGGPYDSQWRVINDTTGGAILSSTTAEDPTVDMGPSAGTVTLGYKVTDIDSVESTEDTVAITALDATNTAVPVADIAVTGWTKQPSSAPSVSSTLGDNADSTYAEYADPAGTVTLEVGLSGLTAPGSGQPVTVWYRSSIFDATSGSVTVSLKQGASTVIATWTADTWSTPDSVRLFSHELTSGQVATITDWNDLRLRFEGTAS